VKASKKFFLCDYY